MDEHDDWDIVSGIGLTALGVAATRAMESKRDDALIDDPYAESFVTGAGTAVPMPTSWASVEKRSETDEPSVDFWSAWAGYVGVRSRFFDEYFLDVSTAGVRQVVILAAGLDTRAFRLSWPPRVELFEIDQPKVLEFKDSILEEQDAVAGCARHVVPIDLRADWPGALLRADFDPERPTAWLAEGLLPYLPGIAMEALFAHVHRLSAAGSWFAAEEIDPDMRAMINAAAIQDAKSGFGVDMAALWPDGDRPDPVRWFREHGWPATAISGAQAADQYGRTLDELAGDAFGKCTLLIAQRNGEDRRVRLAARCNQLPVTPP